MSTNKQIEKGTMYVNGVNFGPAERDPVTGAIDTLVAMEPASVRTLIEDLTSVLVGMEVARG